MPKIDPVTGCTVMTIPEFFASEAAAEGQGRSGADLMDDMFNEMANDAERRREELKRDALTILNDTIIEDNKYLDDSDKMNYSVTEIITSKCFDVKNGFRKSSESFLAHVKCSDNQERWLAFVSWNEPGSYMSPPDGATYVQPLTKEQYDSESFTPDY